MPRTKKKEEPAKSRRKEADAQEEEREYQDLSNFESGTYDFIIVRYYYEENFAYKGKPTGRERYNFQFRIDLDEEEYYGNLYNVNGVGKLITDKSRRREDNSDGHTFACMVLNAAGFDIDEAEGLTFADIDWEQLVGINLRGNVEKREGAKGPYLAVNPTDLVPLTNKVKLKANLTKEDDIFLS